MKKRKRSLFFGLLATVSIACGAIGLCACAPHARVEAPEIYVDEYEILHWQRIENATEYTVDVNGTEYFTDENSLDIFELTGQIGKYDVRVKACGRLPEYDDSLWSNVLEYTVSDGFSEYLEYKETGEDGYEVRAKSKDITGKVIIPKEHNGKPVLQIASKGFSECKEITSVVVPEGVALGNRSFYNCDQLRRVGLPSGLTEIPNDCFYKCAALDKVKLPDSLVGIKSGAFYRCKKLSAIKFPTFLNKIDSEAFSLTALTEIYIPVGVEDICYKSNIVQKINSPFTGLDLEKITVDPDNMFYKSDGNCLIDLRNNIVVAGCKNSVIPDYVSGLGDRAFADCKNLSKIVIPGNIKKITDRTFESQYSEGALDSDAELKATMSEEELAECASYGTLSEVVISEGVEEISSFAFCSVKSIYIPSTVKKFAAFVACAELESITVAENNPVYKSDGNCLIDRADNAVVLGCKNSVIPQYVTSVGGFSGCKNLQSIVLPNSVTEICKNAFNACVSLQSINISEGVTQIGDYAFYGCISLQSVNIPEGVTQIQANALNGCVSLQSVNIPGGVTRIGDYAFYDCKRIEYVFIPRSVKEIGEKAFINTPSLKSVVLPESIEKIGKMAFVAKTIYTDIEITYNEFGMPSYPPEWITRYNLGGVPGVGEILRGVSMFTAFYGCDIAYDENGYPYVKSFTKIKNGEDNLITDPDNLKPFYAVPTRNGYAFDGWATEENGAVVYAPTDENNALACLTASQASEIEDGVTLYAVWKPVA